ncbi:MAG: putative endonuclease 4 [Candidatus Parcubacteria bacterium]|nr:MAG: putative endonuclease 4 [Candidatus Parcubacteria bacterium]
MAKRALKNNVKIGAHVSVSGGFLMALERAKEMGANCIQIFGASPVRWQALLPSLKEAKEFKSLAQKLEIRPIFLHAPYLINLASANERLAKISTQLLKRHLEIANFLGTQGVIFHIGSKGQRPQAEAEELVAKNIKEIFSLVKEGFLLIENSAGAGNLVGDTLEEIGRVIEKVANPRLGFCYDTAHGFEAGVLVDFSNDSLDSFVEKVEKLIGLERWLAIHANDSATAAFSNKDRHENIGQGYLGKEAFYKMLHHPEFRKRPFILEVPGFDDQGPDKENIDILKSLAY